jgi:hypothetical protein
MKIGVTIMNKKNVDNHKILANDSNANIEQTYLPKMRTDYTPSDESVESATGVDFPINMPNPAVDPIVVNNIAYQEFDYTQDMTISEGPDSE